MRLFHLRCDDRRSLRLWRPVALLLVALGSWAPSVSWAQSQSSEFIYRISVPTQLPAGLDPVHHRFNTNSERQSASSIRTEQLMTYRVGFDHYFSRYFAWGLRFISTGSVYRHLGAPSDTGQFVNYYEYEFDFDQSYLVSGDGRLQVEYKSLGVQAGARVFIFDFGAHRLYASGHLGVHYWVRLEGDNYTTYEATEETDLETNGIAPFVGISVSYASHFGVGLSIDTDYTMFGAENGFVLPSVSLTVDPVELYERLLSVLP